jgi:hypothetical protein
MTADERQTVLQEMQDLPNTLLHEVLDFIRFLKGKAVRERSESALLAEPALRRDWLRPEEDEAWRDL